MEELKQALGDLEVLPGDWTATAKLRLYVKVLCVLSGVSKANKETWSWKEEVQEHVERKEKTGPQGEAAQGEYGGGIGQTKGV